MDPATQQLIDGLTKRVEALEAFMRGLGINLDEIFQGAGPVVTGTPTPGGTIAVTYKGKRVNVIIE